jgi:phosphatidate cytidylyltransferase
MRGLPAEPGASPSGAPHQPAPTTPAVALDALAADTLTHNFMRRLLGSLALVGIVLATLFWLPLWVYAVVIIGLATIGLYEFFTMVRHRGILVHRPLTVGLGVVFLLLVAWRSMVEPGLVPTPALGPDATLMNWMWDVFWPATIVLIFIRQLLRANTFEALGGLATTLFGLAYVAALFSYFFYLRTMDPERGAWLVLYLILVTKLGDIGAYAIGNLAGRHTLVPRISPRKTVEGFVGAVLVSTAVAWGARSLLEGQRIFGQAPAPLVSLLLGATLGIAGQLGDLAESLLKRDCQVKDAGRLLPGLGGVLDVIDSLLFTAPLFYGILIYG